MAEISLLANTVRACECDDDNSGRLNAVSLTHC